MQQQLQPSGKTSFWYCKGTSSNYLTSQKIAKILFAGLITTSLNSCNIIARGYRVPGTSFFCRLPSWLRKTKDMHKPTKQKEVSRPLSEFRDGNNCTVGFASLAGGEFGNHEDVCNAETQVNHIPNCYEGDIFHNYSLVVDELGCSAFVSIQPCDYEASESLSSSDKASCQRLVRLEARPCHEILLLQSAQDIWSKIQEVKRYQSQFGHNVNLYPRVWEESTDRNRKSIRNRSSGSVHTITAMQFNTLAEGLSAGPSIKTPFHADPLQSTAKRNGVESPVPYGGFDKVPNPEITLDFSLRRWRLLEVILSSIKDNESGSDDSSPWSSCPGILALEEVDRFYGFFRPALAKFGYDGIFSEKPAAPGVPLGFYSDGCALFWKTDVFEKRSSCKKSYGFGKQVYLIAVLRHKPTGRDLVIAVTHLKAQDSETTEKIRTLQARELVKEVSHVAQGLLSRSEDNSRDVTRRDDSSVGKVPILLLGDFNAEPYGEYRACIPSIIGQNVEVRNNIAENAMLKQNSTHVCCTFRSAYNYGADSFTTWKTRGDKTVKRVIDYIFHNCQVPSACGPAGMRCTHTLSVPPEQDMETTFLPGFRNPSDHLMIAAKFEI